MKLWILIVREIFFFKLSMIKIILSYDLNLKGGVFFFCFVVVTEVGKVGDRLF